MRRPVKEALSLGVLRGALLALGCDPHPSVFVEFAELLGSCNDPLLAAMESAKAAREAGEGKRVFAILDTLRAWPQKELRQVLALSVLAERVKKAGS